MWKLARALLCILVPFGISPTDNTTIAKRRTDMDDNNNNIVPLPEWLKDYYEGKPIPKECEEKIIKRGIKEIMRELRTSLRTSLRPTNKK